MKKNLKTFLSLFVLTALTACGSKVSSSESSNRPSSTPSVSTNAGSSTSSESSEVSSSTSSNDSSSSLSDSSSDSSLPSSPSTPSSPSSPSSPNSPSTSEPVVKSVLEVLSDSSSENGSVASGKLTTNTGYDDTVVEYEYGNDNYGEFIHVIEQWSEKYYGYDKVGNIYGLNIQGGNIGVPYGTLTGNEVNGPSVQLFNSYDDEYKAFGVKGVAASLISYATKNKNKDYQDLSTDDEYKFSFGRYIDDWTPALWIATVSFELNENTITTLDVTFDKYTNYTADYENDGVYYVNDGAKADQTCTVKFEQVIGERTATNPYDIETMYFESFDLKDGDSILTDTINMDAGVEKVLSLANTVPETANPLVDTITVEESTGSIYGNYNSYSKAIDLNCSTPGEYELKISTKNVSKTFKVVVAKPLPSSISVTYYIPSGSTYQTDMLMGKNNTISTYVGTEVSFRATVDPYLADQEYTFEAIGDNKDKLSVKTNNIKPNQDMERTYDVYTVSASEAGTYTLRATSTVNAEVYKDITFVVSEAPSFDSLITNRYSRISYGTVYVDVLFAPDAEDSTKGTVTVKDMYGDAENGTYSYVYDSETRAFALTKLDAEGNALEDDVIISLSFSGNYDLVYETANSTSVLSVYSIAALIANIEWMGSIAAGESIIFQFSKNGTGYISYSKIDTETFTTVAEFYVEFEYTLTEADGIANIEFSSESLAAIYAKEVITAISNIEYDSQTSSMSSTMTVNGTEQTVTFSKTR